MNDNHKKYLAAALTQSVDGLCRQVKLMDFGTSDDGFFCDYEMEKPINPAVFTEIQNKLSSLLAEGQRIQIDEDMKQVLGETFAGSVQKNSYELSGFSGVYFKGNKENQMLQRIYVHAFETAAELKSYLEKVKESEERDHKALGVQLKLFSSSNEIGQGLVLWNPKGAMVRYLLERFSQDAHILNEYEWVYTPHIGKADLWKTSGHLDFFKDAMYSPIEIDGEEYYLKPMNCPFHINIYNNQVHSYRDLPVRLAEYGTVYRYELSGALNGLTRVRGFTQDDAHIICTPEQVEKEIFNALRFSLYILKAFGFEQYNIYISTRPRHKSIGKDEDWALAIESLKKAVTGMGLEYEIDEGGGAFYGPKIDLKLKDGLGREWQCSTIQFDFNLPERFNMTYIGEDGAKRLPMMVHRALFGSLERFMALLIEHYKGDFPLWLSPVQFAIVPIKSQHNEYGKALRNRLKKARYRVDINVEDIHMREKIKRFELEKVPYILIVGDKDIEKGGFSVRSRANGNLGFMTWDELVQYIQPDIEKGVPAYILEE